MRVPKIIHFLWMGPNPPSKECMECLLSWKHIHRTYEFKIWTNRDLNQTNFPLTLQYIWKCKSFAEWKDVAALEILLKYGGFYIDLDIYCLQRIENFVDPSSTLVVCDETSGVWQRKYHEEPPEKRSKKIPCTNAFIGCVPGDPMFMDAILELASKKWGAFTPTNELTGPWSFGAMIEKKYVDPGFQILTPQTLYEILWNHEAKTILKWAKQIEDREASVDIAIVPLVTHHSQKKILGMHLWAQTWRFGIIDMLKKALLFKSKFLRHHDLFLEVEVQEGENMEAEQKQKEEKEKAMKEWEKGKEPQIVGIKECGQPHAGIFGEHTHHRDCLFYSLPKSLQKSKDDFFIKEDDDDDDKERKEDKDLEKQNSVENLAGLMMDGKQDLHGKMEDEVFEKFIMSYYENNDNDNKKELVLKKNATENVCIVIPYRHEFHNWMRFRNLLRVLENVFYLLTNTSKDIKRTKVVLSHQDTPDVYACFASHPQYQTIISRLNNAPNTVFSVVHDEEYIYEKKDNDEIGKDDDQGKSKRRIKTKKKGFNRSRAMNVGLQSVQSSIRNVWDTTVFFYDADIILSVESFDACLAAINESPYVSVSPYSTILDLTESESVFLDMHATKHIFADRDSLQLYIDDVAGNSQKFREFLAADPGHMEGEGACFGKFFVLEPPVFEEEKEKEEIEKEKEKKEEEKKEEEKMVKKCCWARATPRLGINPAGGVFVMSQKMFALCGGWDESFVGWGMEDDALVERIFRAERLQEQQINNILKEKKSNRIYVSECSDIVKYVETIAKGNDDFFLCSSFPATTKKEQEEVEKSEEEKEKEKEKFIAFTHWKPEQSNPKLSKPIPGSVNMKMSFQLFPILCFKGIALHQNHSPGSKLF